MAGARNFLARLRDWEIILAHIPLFKASVIASCKVCAAHLIESTFSTTILPHSISQTSLNSQISLSLHNSSAVEENSSTAFTMFLALSVVIE